MPIDINELRDYKGGDPEKYRNYMRTLEADWRQPALDDVMVGHWCDRAAAAFSNLQPYFDDYKLAIAR